MTNQQLQNIEAAIEDAFKALPNGDDRQLTEWVMAHRLPSFPQDTRDALRYAGLKDLIDARKMGITLQE